MYPTLVKIGGLSIPSYGVMILIGVLCALFISRKLARSEGLPISDLSDLVIYTLLIALIGARLLLILTELDQFIRHPRQLLSMLTSAGNFFGGLITGALFAILYIRRKKLPLLPVLDVFAPALAVGHAFGRLGCLLAGCCWGREAAGCPVSISFHNHAAQTGIPLDIPLYPTQAAESIFNLLLGVALYFLFWHKRFSGQIFALYLMAYGSWRFISEYFRGDGGRGYLFGDMSAPFSSLSIPQLMALIALVMGIILYRHAKNKSS